MLNGVTKLCITKVDVLNNFESIGYANEYAIQSEKTKDMPTFLTDDLMPIYESAKGWNRNIAGIKNYSELPVELKDYVQLIETNTEAKVSLVSVGPGRDELFEF